MTRGDRTLAAGAGLIELDQIDPSLDLSAAVRAGARAVHLAGVHVLSADEPRPTLALVRLLRESASEGVPVTWRGVLADGIDPELLVSLPPPKLPNADEPDAALVDWRLRYGPGLCYFRIGPDFVLVKDVRRQDAAARFCIDDEGAVEAFRSLEDVAAVDELEPSALRILEDLRAEGLALQLGGFATLIAYRMRRWPVPAIEM